MTFLDGVTFGLARPDQIRTMSGLEIMQAMIDRKLPAPPMAQTLGFLLTEVSDGVAIFEGETGPQLFNPMGTVHGGWALTLIDSATGCAGMTTLPPGGAYTTVETKANFVRAILGNTGRVRCTGRVLNRGRQIITTDASITDASGRLLAHGTSTLMVLAG